MKLEEMRTGPVRSTFGALLSEQAENFGDHVFLSIDDQDFTFAQLEADANRLANALRDQLGISKGDHVALLMNNCSEYVASVFGLAKIGAVAVPLNTASKGAVLEYFLRHSESRAIVVDEALFNRAQPLVAGIEAIEHTVVVQARGATRLAGTVAFADLQSDDETCPDVVVDCRDPMFLMYTSGTTGPSKGVVSPHSQGLSVGQQLLSGYGYTSDDVLFSCLPLFHVNALWYSLVPALLVGAKIVVSGRFSASTFWDEIVSSGATQTNALGAMVNIALKNIGSVDRSQLKLRQMMVVPSLGREHARRLTDLGIKVTSLFAQTETFAVALYGPDDPLDKAGSSGRARKHATLAILNDDDNVMVANEVGEIAVRPMQPGIMMDGYYNMPSETLQAFSTLWFHTGDRGYIDADGYLYFVDRKKDSIRRRGENISAFELEMIIIGHQTVSEAAAIAVPSDLGEDDVFVYVVIEDGCSFEPEKIIRFCDDSMPYFMVPRYLEPIAELPKTSSEKIEKYKLRELAARRTTRTWDREAHGIKLHR